MLIITQIKKGNLINIITSKNPSLGLSTGVNMMMMIIMREKYLDLAGELKKAMEHERDVGTHCN